MTTDATTIPTEVLETLTESIPVTDPTAATEAALDIESLKELMDGFDPASLLPQLETVFEKAELICRIAVMVGPVILLLMGLIYLFFTPREANHYIGYRCYFGMGSVQAWRFTQRLSGLVFGILGLVLTVVMLFVTNGFAGTDVTELVWTAVTCLIWEAALALLATLGVNITAAVVFDRKGEFRKRKGK
ncbi:MAG: SdpI family protein [Oscillospiraceae bacterium]|nr:SdpI family protein [Oscillospiraceae bacterium]